MRGLRVVRYPGAIRNPALYGQTTNRQLDLDATDYERPIQCVILSCQCESGTPHQKNGEETGSEDVERKGRSRVTTLGHPGLNVLRVPLQPTSGPS